MVRLGMHLATTDARKEAVCRRCDVELAAHPKASVRTGTVCSYRPERPVSWRVDLGPAP